MPAWWGRKSSKNKEEQNHQLKTPNPHENNHVNLLKFSTVDGKRKSFDEGILVAPRGSRELSGGSSGFSGFDSDRGHPLPRPSSQGDHVIGSGSVSSVSSSGSSDDQGYRVHGDMKFNVGQRSPSQSSRGPTSPTSPLHPRLSGMSLESPNGRRQDDGRSQSECHPLPLPPGSPTSPSAMSSSRTGVAENSPSSLSKWKKGKLLGRGTFGHVYLGFNSEKGKMCAIKEVRVICDDQTSKECFKQLNQEINLLSQLYHPNIVQYYGSELGEETLSVYLEYVSGGSIHKLLQEYGPFKEPVIQNYTRQILSGLSYLHGRNTVHRDIKGANILVDPNGEIKLADFGMAKHIRACSSMLSFKGSPYWMAPEVVMNTSGYGLAVDIWSLGCTILEMATSKPPWSQYEGVAAIFKIGNSKDIPEIPDHLSNYAKDFIRRCLHRDPSARPTAAQLLEHPFVRDQTTTRVANNNITNDAFPFAFDGSRTPPPMDLHSHRPSDGHYGKMPLNISSRVMKNPRENARTITSLPVSPCSSPLRQHTPAYKNCFLSPPHPSYTFPGSSSSNLTDFLVTPPKPNASYMRDTLLEPSYLRTQTPNVSPRSRLI